MGLFHNHSDHHGHHHHGHHDHGHHDHSANKQALFISFILIFTFMIIEFVGGFLTNSLVLISDVGHMLSDAFALGLSLLAFKIGEKQADYSKTYGYKRFEILAAFINGLTLLGISLYIFWEAYQRFFEPSEIKSVGMLIIASIGLLINILVAFILIKGNKDENLNIRSALLHVMGDLLGSVGAIIASLLIILFGWYLADPIASVIVAILVLISGWRVTNESVHILMEGKPKQLSVKDIEKELRLIPGVKEIHDLHIWSITSNFPTLTCHLVVKQETDRDEILKQSSDVLRTKFKIHHTTIQIEGEELKLSHDEDCCN